MKLYISFINLYFWAHESDLWFKPAVFFLIIMQLDHHKNFIMFNMLIFWQCPPYLTEKKKNSNFLKKVNNSRCSRSWGNRKSLSPLIQTEKHNWLAGCKGNCDWIFSSLHVSIRDKESVTSATYTSLQHVYIIQFYVRFMKHGTNLITAYSWINTKD